MLGAAALRIAPLAPLEKSFALSAVVTVPAATLWRAGSGLGLNAPLTAAARSATAAAAGTTSSDSLRDGSAKRGRAAAGCSARTRARRCSGACGACARSRVSMFRSFVDIVHPLFEPSERTAEPGRDGGLADAEHARDARAVELEQHAQSDDLSLG